MAFGGVGALLGGLVLSACRVSRGGGAVSRRARHAGTPRILTRTCPSALAPRTSGPRLAESDPWKLLAGFAGINVAINTRSADVHRILVSAAGSDAEAAALLAEYARRRDAGQGQIAGLLDREQALRPDLTERDAADIVHALMSPELYRMLVIERGWTPRRYAKWLAETLAAQLLPGVDQG
jgi:hypothetical protein